MSTPDNANDILETAQRQTAQQVTRGTSTFNSRINNDVRQMDQEAACENEACEVFWKPQRPAA